MSALTDQIEALAPGQLYFKIYSAVNNGFLTSTQVKTNESCERIQAKAVTDHYLLPMSNTGNNPATHHGSNGLMEKLEAFDMLDWYDAQNPASIVVWFLTKDNRVVWKNVGGVQVEPLTAAPSYIDDFLTNITPAGLQPINPPI